MRRMLSIGGTPGPGRVSVWWARAPRCVGPASQYDGGTQSYGPVILTPLAPDTSVGFALAEEIVGLGQLSCVSIVRYTRSTSDGGGPSLPFSQTNTLGWPRTRRI